MGGLMSRNKGQRGEREVIRLLQPTLNSVFAEFSLEAPSLERNLMQTAKGGFDIIGLEWMALEVKYQEVEHLEQWWEQTKAQAAKLGTDGKWRLVKEPILIYRKNNVKWNVRLFGILMAGEILVKAPVIVSAEVFLVWFENRVRTEIRKGIVESA
jgi:hypothetical protein